MSNKSLTSEERREVERTLNSPIADADLQFYSKAALWTIDEASALSFGKNPETVNWTSIRPLRDDFSFAQDYDRRRQLIKRAIKAGQLEKGPEENLIRPGDFLTWAKQAGIPMPEALWGLDSSGTSLGGSKCTDDSHAQLSEELEEARAKITALREEKEELKQQNAELSQQLAEAASASEKDLGARERDTLQILLGALAVGYLGFDPAQRNDACKMIEDLILETEHRRSRKTISDHVKSGCDNFRPEDLKLLKSKYQDFKTNAHSR